MLDWCAHSPYSVGEVVVCHYLWTKLGLELSQRGHATYLWSIGLGLGLVRTVVSIPS